MKKKDDIINNACEVIFEESESIRNLISQIDNQFVEAVEAIYNSEGRVIVTGVGKSAIIGNKIVATLNSTGTPAMFMHAADAIHGDLGMIMEKDIVICLSKSGNTPEIKVLVPLLTLNKNKLIAIVSDEKSYLAEKADFVIKAKIEKEACPNNLAPTNSTTAQLVIGDALAVCLLKKRNFSKADFAKFHPGGVLGKKVYMRIKDIFSSAPPPKVTAETSVSDSIIEITRKRFGATAVVDNLDNIIGIITDGDLRRMLQKYKDFNSLKAKDIMSPTPKTTTLDTLAVEAFRLMEKNSITQLLVVEGTKYIGIIHLHDIIREGIV